MNESTDTEVSPKSQGRSNVRLIDCFMEIIAYTLYRIDPEGGKQPDFETVQADYDALFERSGRYARSAKIPSSDWKRACFPVCAWVDEQIMCSSWSEKERWQQNQLQLKFFRTTMAGQEFFSRLDKLKESDREIREVYTYCLALGFKGRYYSDDDQLELSEIKADNILKYFSEDQEMNLPEDLFPEAYQQRLSRSSRAGFYGMMSSWRGFVFLILPPAAVIGAYIFYYERLAGLADKMF
ncbi:MAG: DotU family type IV/VI secretion system protein [Desulfobacterales bacterium]